MLNSADVIFLRIWQPIKNWKIILIILKRDLDFSTEKLSSNEYKDKLQDSFLDLDFFVYLPWFVGIFVKVEFFSNLYLSTLSYTISIV